MFKITEYVNASSVWPAAKDFQDFGSKPGLVRGYNIEVKTSKGTIEWMSCEYIYGEPEEVFNDKYHTWSREDYGFVPTGRVCFRGYGREEYDFEEHEDFIVTVDIECEEKIMEVLAKNPGLRMRTIARLIHKNPVTDVLPALYKLKDMGRVKSEMYRDIANMEFYDKWYVNC